jgi:ADP-dependent NAD(P)H-hydrate dehydratase / NAD(P)H-hydrate epimerase
MKIVSVAQMRALEAAAFASGISEAALQERAGHAVAEEISDLLAPGERVVVLVGHGNNGRDGMVAAEWLSRHQTAVDLVLAPRHAVSAGELARLRSIGTSVISAEDEAGVTQALRSARVAVDALAGIGAHGALRDPLASLARQLNTASLARGVDLHVLGLDLPSGVDADTGDVPGEAVWADSTVTLGAVKQGLLRFPAAQRVGRLVARDIGIPPDAEAELPIAMLDEARLAGLLPARPLDAHKYRFGRALVIAGTDHFPGAAVLCCGGAARVGAGLVTLASTRDVQNAVVGHHPEVTYTRWNFVTGDGPKEARSLMPYLRSHNALVVGPGLGRGHAITRFVGELLKVRPPDPALLVDADGLVALSEIQDWWTRLGPNAILTPHSGELERLVGHELDTVEPLWVHAQRLAQQWGCVLIAKGPFTCVASPDGRVDVWPRANPALSTGGTGDVLAGICGGLLAQGLSVWDAARLAVGVHGLAAARIVDRRTWRTLLASDLVQEVPAVLGSLSRLTRRR